MSPRRGAACADSPTPAPGPADDVDDDVIVPVAPAVLPGVVLPVALPGVAVELLERLGSELPALTALPDVRLRVLAAGWLAGFRSARTRRAYAGDLAAWATWCAHRRLDVLDARRVQVDLHATGLLDAGAAASSVARRLSALSSFYRFTAGHDLLPHLGLAGSVGGSTGSAGGNGVASPTGNPVVGVRRPAVDPDHTTTVGLSRDQARALVAAADTDTGPQQPRTAAVIRLLLHNALRVDELAAADLTGLGHRPAGHHPTSNTPAGSTHTTGTHRTLVVTRKGGRRTTVALAPDTTRALEAYLEHRAAAAGVDRAALRGPLLATRTDGRLTQKAVWELVRRLAHRAGIDAADQLSPHSLRHTAITLALDAGAGVRDVQDFAGHRDPRTTRRYDHARSSLDRSAAYAVASWIS